MSCTNRSSDMYGNYGNSNEGLKVGEWMFQVLEGDPIALLILLIILAVLLGSFVLVKFCNFKFGENETWD